MDPKTVVDATVISERQRQQEEDKSANDGVPVETSLKTTQESSRVLEDQEECEHATRQHFTTDGENPSSSKRRCLASLRREDDVSFSGQEDDTFANDAVPGKSSEEESRFLDDQVNFVTKIKKRKQRFTDAEMVKQSTSEEADAGLAESHEDLSSKLKRLGLDAQDYETTLSLLQLARGTTQTQNQEMHALTTTQTPPPNLEKPFKCNVCKKGFSSQQALGGHLSSNKHHSVTRKPRPIENAIAKKRPKSTHECQTCHKAFPNGRALGGHRAHDHKKRNHDEVNTNGSHVVCDREQKQSARPWIDLNKTPSPEEDTDDEEA